MITPDFSPFATAMTKLQAVVDRLSTLLANPALPPVVRVPAETFTLRQIEDTRAALEVAIDGLERWPAKGNDEPRTEGD
jgi:hypothetical protein